MNSVGRLHVITSDAKFSHVQIARRAIAGGANVIQFRDKAMTLEQRVAIAVEIGRLCRDAGITFIVNDRIDIAMAADADGVHVGIDDMPVAVARRLLGTGRIIGASASTPGQAEAAVASGADYVGAGHVFKTASKTKTMEPIGTSGLERVVRAVSVPVIAIGGIDDSNLEVVLQAGAYGVAVIHAVCGADDPEQATRKLKTTIQAGTR